MAGKRVKIRGSEKRAARRLLVLILALILAAVFLVAGIRLYRQSEANEAVIESLEEEVLDESARADSLRERIEEGVTESFIREEAGKAGLAESDETIFRLEPQN